MTSSEYSTPVALASATPRFTTEIPFFHDDVWQIGSKTLDFRRQVAVMAIVNRTPDSFHDRGADFALHRAIETSLRAVEDGADWVDVGGVPFGRGPDVSVEEELDRVLPVIEAVVSQSDVVVSVDTNRAVVAAEAIRAGAAVINDTSGFWDPDMPGVIARGGAAVILTHSLHPPRSEPVLPRYDDVVDAVSERLSALIGVARNAGISPDRLVIDPGHDLNKNTLHSLELTRRLPELVDLGYPLLVALSNKDFIGETLDRERGQRLIGSIAAAVACVLAGARIVRAHDVAATVDAVRMTESMLGLRPPVRVWHNNGQN